MTAEDDFHLRRVAQLERELWGRRRATDLNELTNVDVEDVVAARQNRAVRKLRDLDVKAFPLTGPQVVTGLYEDATTEAKPKRRPRWWTTFWQRIAR